MGFNSLTDLPVSVADFVVNGVDLLLLALNNTRRGAERIRSFRYAEANASLSVAAAGTDLAACTYPAGVTANGVKSIDSAQIPIAGGDTIPIEFMTNDALNERIRTQLGRQPYDATKTLAQLGVVFNNPIAYQQASRIYLYPPSMFTFPVAAVLNVTRFMADYTMDADEDFFCKFAPDYMLWQGVIEANKLWQQFVGRQEGTVDEAAVSAMAQAALSALLIWDAGVDDSTSTPEVKAPTGGQ